MSDLTDDMLDDDVAMEEWLSLSDEQQDAILEREMIAYAKWWGSLTPRIQARIVLRRIMENRARLRKPELCTIRYEVKLWKEGIRRNQRQLVKIRIWRSTGVYPGEA